MAFSTFLSSSKLNLFLKRTSPIPSLFFSSSTTPYPLQYELITYRPARSQLSDSHRPKPQPQNPSSDSDVPISNTASDSEEMDKSKRKYYLKRRKRMYGLDDDDDDRPREDKYIELKPEVVEFRTLHAREEELYFYDTFAFPWEKEKHYRMVYQLEKKYFPDQCLDKAFAEEPAKGKRSSKSEGTKEEEKVDGGAVDQGLVFFEEENGMGETGSSKKLDVSEKKVEELFKCLKKVPSVGEVSTGEPYIVTRKTGLPPRWDGPYGTVLMVNKPKGWTSFTVCGKLRRLVKVKKVGHAGTLDPMATGLLIVCVGKATKMVERFQGMIKGYSGVFRLGEATSTWDADSPVILREPWEHIKEEDIKKTAASFCGEIWQVPPMFSAIKVGGEKMYEKARRGEMVELSPRRISIYQFDIERSLDNSCAHLTALRRDSIGEYSADDAWEFEELQEQITRGYI